MKSPTRRVALACCVALLIVAAGCTGGTNPSTTTGTWSPNASAEQYPPGVADDGTLANASTLVDAHVAATADESTRLTFETNRSNESSVRRYAHGPNGTTYYSTVNRTNSGSRVAQAFYGAESYGYTRTTVSGETTYAVLQNVTTGIVAPHPKDTFGPAFNLESVLAGGNYSVNGTVERGGRTLVQLTAREPPQNPPGFVTEYEGTALVAPDGAVHSVDASVGTGADNTTDRRFETAVTLDTDVEWSGPPSWVAELPHLSLSTVEDGHAVEIRNTGGEALPANASLEVLGANETSWSGSRISAEVSGTVTTDARLEPGDAVYVTAGENGSASSFALHDEPTRGAYSFGFAGLRGTHENVAFRLSTGIRSVESTSA